MSDLSIAPLVSYLQSIKVVGPACDYKTATIISRGSNSLILRHLPAGHCVPNFYTVIRSSRQYYRVDAFIYSADGSVAGGKVIHKRYRSYITVSDFLRSLIL